MADKDDFFEHSTLNASIGSAPPPASDIAYVLRVVDGPDAGLVVLIDGDRPLPVLVGKSPACAARLSDPQVSRRHLELDVREGRLRIRDVGSTNGTTLDGVTILDAYALGGETIRIGRTALRVENTGRPSSQPLSNAVAFGRYVGASAAMRRLYPLCERLAASAVPVIVEGETGTGKEQLAEAIHELGPRAKRPFVVFDCTAVSATLVESELFGHERGAFTGAVAARAGVFELAEGGTLLIDEVGDMPLELQAKLLRVLDRGEYRRVGGTRTTRCNVRVIAATRRNLDREVQDGRFRDDLFHRLAVTRLELPPLRRREGDVGLLAEHFARSLGGAHTSATGGLEVLLRRYAAYDWPGNVRELRNVVARWLALGETQELEDLAGAGDEESPPATSVTPDTDLVAEVLAKNLPLACAREMILHAFEGRYLAHVLAAHGGNVTRAAAAAGVKRRQMQRLKVKRLDSARPPPEDR